MHSLILIYCNKLVHTWRHPSTLATNCTMALKAYTHIHTDRHAIRKLGMWNTKQSKWDKHRHRPTSPDSQSNGVDEVRWKSLYVSVSLSVSALITQQAAQYSYTQVFCLSVSFYLALSFSLCSTPHQSPINWQSWREWKRSLVCVCLSTRSCACVYNTIHLRIKGLLPECTERHSVKCYSFVNNVPRLTNNWNVIWEWVMLYFFLFYFFIQQNST